MANFSYMQTDFRGGIWSPESQGRMADERWKTAMNVSLNGWPSEGGNWSRRPGLRYIQHTRRGQKALLRPFRFGRDQSYQIEFTPLKMRFVVGLELLMEPAEITVDLITNPTGTVYGYGEGYGLSYGGLSAPGVVHASTLPAAWANGDTVIFNIDTQTNLPTTVKLFGRQFEIADIDHTLKTFTLKDPITQEYVGGTEIDWIAHPGNVDTVQKVKEFVTIYTADDIANKFIRVVQSIADILIMCDQKPSYLLQQSGTTQFTFGLWAPKDGPYFDVNETLTTLTPSATTGNITLTASSVVGINEGDGFKTTDVGRLIRFQCGPPVWDAGTVFKTNDKTLGSDGNIYRAVKSNSAHDPIGDDGTYWEISPDTIFWTWLKITSRTSSTVVHADVMGDDLKIVNSGGGLFFGHSQASLTPTTFWRIGVYTDTPDPATGRKRWPTCGTYHEGRLQLAGAEPNRVDATKSLTTVFDFAPTYKDGTVADDSGLSFVLNSRDAQYINWMMTTNDGMAIGTIAGEWIIRASQTDDPLTPFDVQARLITQYGTNNSEPVQAYGGPIFIQARRRKVLANRRHPYGQPEAMNLSINADSLMTPGVSELAWMQEPGLSLFTIRDDGKLLGCSYKYSMLEEDYFGWHQHEHGAGRDFEALSYGPNFQGTGDALYVVTALPDDDSSVTNPRWIETIMPVASSGDAQWVAWHTDASGTAWYIRRMLIANGDSFDGLRVYGLEYAEGLVLHPFIGGLDIGNFTVTDGHLDIPFAPTAGTNAKFTLAFMQALDDGTDFGDGVWGMKLRWANGAIIELPSHPLNTLAVMDGAGGATTVSASQYLFHWDRDRELMYRFNTATVSIKKFDAITGNYISEGTAGALFTNGAGHTFSISSGEWVLSVDGQYLFGSSTTGSSWNDQQYCLIDAPSLTQAGWVDYQVIGTQKAIANGPVNNACCTTYIDPLLGVTKQLAVLSINAHDDVGASISNASEITLVDLNTVAAQGASGTAPGEGGVYGDNVIYGVSNLRVCRGQEDNIGYTNFFAWADDLNVSGQVRVYGCSVTPNPLFGFPAELPQSFGMSQIAQLAPTDFDAGWLTMGTMSFAMDLMDGRLVGLVNRLTGTGADTYLFKLDFDGSFKWKVTPPSTVPISAFFHPMDRLNYGYWIYMKDNVLANEIYVMRLTDGSVYNSLLTQVKGFSGLGGSSGRMIYDDGLSSLILWGSFNSDSGAVVVSYLGDYAVAHQNSFWFDEVNRLYLGIGRLQDQNHRELNQNLDFIPVNFGISFVSRGQILPPDFGQDAGARAGPAFGKIRRNHWWSVKFVDSFGVFVGTAFNKLIPVAFVNDAGAATVTPDRYSGIITTTLQDDYSKEGAICWESTRQFPCCITAIGGYIVTQDK